MYPPRNMAKMYSDFHFPLADNTSYSVNSSIVIYCELYIINIEHESKSW